MNRSVQVVGLLVAGGVVLFCAVFGIIGVLLMRQLSGLCEPKGRGDLTSLGGDYEVVLTRDDCDDNVGATYVVTVARDADGFEEPGVRPAVGEGLSDGDAVRVSWASDDELVISALAHSNVNVNLDSSGVAVRREAL